MSANRCPKNIDIDKIVKEITDRIKKLEIDLKNAKKENNIRKVQVIAGELHEALNILKDKKFMSLAQEAQVPSKSKKTVEYIIEEYFYNLQNEMFNIEEDGQISLKKLLCVFLTLLQCMTVFYSTLSLPFVEEDTSDLVITSVLILSFFQIIKNLSIKVINAAENILYTTPYDIPDFKELIDDVNTIIKEIRSEGECPVCYRKFNESEDEEKQVTKRWLVPCGHYFCEDCIENLQSRNMLDKCPYCRQDVQGIATRKLAEHYQFKNKKSKKVKSRKNKKSKNVKSRKNKKSKNVKSRKNRKSKNVKSRKNRKFN